MTSPEPLGNGEAKGRTRILPWEDIWWVVVGAAVVGLLHGFAQDTPFLLALVIGTIIPVLIGGASLFVSDKWRQLKGWGAFALSVLVIDAGFCLGWIIGSDLSELWAVWQQLDDIDFYYYRLPWPTM